MSIGDVAAPRCSRNLAHPSITTGQRGPRPSNNGSTARWARTGLKTASPTAGRATPKTGRSRANPAAQMPISINILTTPLNNILTNNESGAIATAMYDLASRLTTVVSGSAVTSYSFDNNGNQILVNASGSLTTMAYDKENRLATYLAPGSSVSYAYSGDMLKRCERVSGSPTTLIWDGQNYLQGKQ